jgi:HAE1 family hydrophobic/amphiphilic exporter-1
MILIAIGTFIGALVVPAKGIYAFLAVMVVITAAVLALTFVRFPRGLRGGLMKGGVAVLCFVGIFMAIGAAPAGGKLGFEFFPKDDSSEFIVEIDTPPGSSLEYTRLKAEEVAAMAREIPEVRYTYTTIGGQGGAVDAANVYVRLLPKADRDRGQEEIASALRERAKGVGGATAALGTGNFGGVKQIMIQLQGPDIAVLNGLAEQVQAQVRQVEGAVDISLSTKGQKPELTVDLNRGLAGSLGVTAAQVAQALRPAFAGIDVGDWVDPSGETRDVYIRFAPEARARTGDLERVPVTLQGPQGPVTVPLGQVATVSRELGPAQINHLDRERVINVEANTEGRPLSEVVGDITTRINENVRMPVGYQLSFGGDTEDQVEVFTRIIFALGVAVMLMYLILVVQFGSFLDPLAILLSLPLSLIGVVLGLWLAGSTLNLMSMIGIIMLMGIVAKNAILLVDFAKWGKERGLDRRQALIEAGAIRLRPILMTTFALIAGMLPVALGTGEGSQFRAPMGIAIIGGVVTSTLLTLLVIPTVWELLDEMRESFMGRFRGGSGGHGAHGGGHGGPREVPHEPARVRREPEPEPALRTDIPPAPRPGMA